MATVTSTFTERVVREGELTLVLTPEEADVLIAVLSRVDGNAHPEFRSKSNSIWNALRQAGVAYENPAYHAIQGRLHY